MQFLITVGDDGKATAQVLETGPPREPTLLAVSEETAFDGGAAPANGERPKTGPAVAAAEIVPEAVDAGAAPTEVPSAEKALGEALLPEGGEPEGLGAEPTISDMFPTRPPFPELRPVE